MSDLSDKLKNIRKYSKTIQGLISILSNYRCGVKIDENFNPKGIFKYEGGVVVNDKEIVIIYDKFEDKIFCYDDFNIDELKESEVTKQVVNDLIEKINWDNEETLNDEIKNFIKEETKVSEDVLIKILTYFYNNPLSGDPLRRLLVDYY